MPPGAPLPPSLATHITDPTRPPCHAPIKGPVWAADTTTSSFSLCPPPELDLGTVSYPSPSSLVREDRSFITAIPYVFTLKRHPRRRQSGDTLSPQPWRIPLPEGILACPWLSTLIYGESSEPVRHPR